MHKAPPVKEKDSAHMRAQSPIVESEAPHQAPNMRQATERQLRAALLRAQLDNEIMRREYMERNQP